MNSVDAEERGREAKAGRAILAMGAFLLALVAGSLADKYGYASRLVKFKSENPAMFWSTLIVLALSAAILTLACSVLWSRPVRSLIPANQLTARIKQFSRFVVGAIMFGAAAIWGAVAGSMVTSPGGPSTAAESQHFINTVLVEPFRLVLMLALIAVLFVICVDLYVVGKQGRRKVFSELHPALAWLAASLTSPGIVGGAMYASLTMVLACKLSHPPIDLPAVTPAPAHPWVDRAPAICLSPTQFVLVAIDRS